MSNRLANEASPYLRDHAENPVDWYPWGEVVYGQDRPMRCFISQFRFAAA